MRNPNRLMVGELTVRRLGQERASLALPFRSLVEAGIPFALGSDGLLNPFDVAPPELPKSESILTMIGGKIVRQKFQPDWLILPEKQ